MIYKNHVSGDVAVQQGDHAVRAVATEMSPHASTHVTAMLAGDVGIATMHGARREIAAYADRLVGRSRRIPFSLARLALIAAAQAAYDEITGRLAARGAL